jgi:iron complex transport system substrate-binding protein
MVAILSLALLDRDNRLSALWHGIIWRKNRTWRPGKCCKEVAASAILDMGFSDKGNVDLESVISRQPD